MSAPQGVGSPAGLERLLVLEERFWARVLRLPGDGCWEWQGARVHNTYGRAWDGEQVEYAHRLSWRLSHGPIPPGFLVCHRCDNPPCVRPDHLFLGRSEDNVADMVKKGRHVSRAGEASGSRRRPESRPRGEDNVRAKLTTEMVLAIREEFASKGTPKLTLARRYGVNPSTISSIVLRRTWRHVP